MAVRKRPEGEASPFLGPSIRGKHLKRRFSKSYNYEKDKNTRKCPKSTAKTETNNLGRGEAGNARKMKRTPAGERGIREMPPTFFYACR
jgi:hypothetical protein